MMEVESFSCLRNSEPVPLTSSSLTSPKLTLTGSEIKMVVETQSHTIRPMTPDPLPEPSEQRYQLMPPENAVTPSPDNPPPMDYANVHGSIVSTDTDHPTPSPSPSSKAADTDGETHSSPSQSSEKQRSRRKPTLEDIVRRMKEAETSYYTDESEDENMNEPLTIDMEQSHDEVDGSYPNGFYKNGSVREEMKAKLFNAQNGDEINDLKATLLGISNGMDYSNAAKSMLADHANNELNDCVRAVLGAASSPENVGDIISPALLEAKSRGEINDALRATLFHLQSGGEINDNLKTVLLNGQNGDLHENLKMALLGAQNGRLGNEDSAKSNQTGLSPRADPLQKSPLHEKSKEISDNPDLKMTPKSNIQSNISIDNHLSTMGDNFKQPGNYLTPKMNGMSNGWYSGPFSGLPPFPYLPSPLDHRIGPNFLPLFDNSFPSSAEVEKDYLKCQYCERTFRRQKNLENHIDNTHHGKGPVRRKSENGTNDMYFKCTHCPYTTKHQSNLYVHLRIHTGERPYICGACGVQYSQSHSLKSHIINKHDGIMTYYIKEKRTRSPRGLGYLTTQVLPEMSMYNKLNHSPSLVNPNLAQQQANRTPKINGLHQPGHQLPSMPMSQSDYMAKSLDLSKVSSEQLQGMQASPQQSIMSQSSPHGYMNGHGSFSYGSMTPHVKQVSPNNQAAPITPYQRNHTPLQEISNSFHHNDNFGAMDLTKKSTKDSQEIHRSFEKGSKCPDGPDCINCLHAMKLRRLRTNVVRMLSILVPNLNFEEKGISSEGDSVDELLHDVIESNIQDEDMSE